MGDGDAALYLHLRKLPATTSEETLGRVLETLWDTRGTGLALQQKTALVSLLNFSSLHDLAPVLACLRSIIRKTVRQDLSRDDIQKLFPIELSMDLQSTLLRLLLRYQNEWKEETSRDQPFWQNSRISHLANGSMVPTAFRPFPTSEIASSMWPLKGDASRHYTNDDDGCTPAMPSKLQQQDSTPTLRNNDSTAGKMTLPCLKSITWIMENRNSAPSNRVAIISLKLQDPKTSSLGEVELQFQLSRDTLEAMLRSMSYIKEKFSDSVAAVPEPVAKKQRQ